MMSNKLGSYPSLIPDTFIKYVYYNISHIIYTSESIKYSNHLSTKTVEGAALPLEGVDNIHGGDGLPLGVLGVGDGIPNDVLKEHL